MLLVIWLIVLIGGALLAAAAFYVHWRLRTPRAPMDDDEEGSGVAPLLIMPQTRHSALGAVPPVPRWKPAVTQTAKSYIAPLSGLGVEGAIQLWPGRLVPAEGGSDQEIRFIRTPGVNRFTFGRSAGPAATHIQLLAPTASRMHAYMIVQDGRWRIGNMSTTNAVVVNGVALDSADAERWLEDGDRIEMGELALIFRER